MSLLSLITCRASCVLCIQLAEPIRITTAWKACPKVPKSTPIPCITITVLISDYLLKRSTWCHECIWSHQLGFGIIGERKEVCWHRQVSNTPQVWLGAMHRFLFRSQPFCAQISHVVWKGFKGETQISLELPSKTKALIPQSMNLCHCMPCLIPKRTSKTPATSQSKLRAKQILCYASSLYARVDFIRL